MVFMVDLHHGVGGDRAEQYECREYAVVGFDFTGLHGCQCAEHEDECGDCGKPLGPERKTAIGWLRGVALANQNNLPYVDLDIAFLGMPAVWSVHSMQLWRSVSWRFPYP